MNKDFGYKSKDFLFQHELLQQVEKSSMIMGNVTELNFKHDKDIPAVLNGDLEKFKLIMQILIDFQIQYLT